MIKCIGFVKIKLKTISLKKPSSISFQADVNNIGKHWARVIISWSHTAGLSVKVNDSLISDPYGAQEEGPWNKPATDGLRFGHNGVADEDEAVILDDFELIPAELHQLSAVGQNVGKFGFF